MTRRAWRPLSAALLLLLLILLAVRVCQRPMGPMEVSLWYWHSPFRLSRADVGDLHTMGVRRLFVRAGTISATGDGSVMLILPQSWRSSPGAPPLDLVFVLDYGVVRHFDTLATPGMAHCLVDAFLRQQRNAQRAGLLVGHLS